MTTHSPSRRREHALGGASFLVVIAADWSMAAILNWSCPLQQATGLLCPGCGATHALSMVVHGDVGQALRFNALVPLGLVALAVGAVALLGAADERLPSVDRLWRVVAIVLIGFGLMRNMLAISVSASS